DRLRLRFDFASYHEQWNRQTLAAADPIDIYRTRQTFSPVATLVLAEPLQIEFGVSFSRFRPVPPAAKTESANAVVSTLRYHQRWGSDKDEQQQEASAEYSLRAATKVLETDSVYTRHAASARYRYRHDRSSLEIAFLTGLITGRAPLYERFVLG